MVTVQCYCKLKLKLLNIVFVNWNKAEIKQNINIRRKNFIELKMLTTKWNKLKY